jgi:hypothetical protein
MLKGLGVLAGVLFYFFIAYSALLSVSTDVIQMVA